MKFESLYDGTLDTRDYREVSSKYFQPMAMYWDLTQDDPLRDGDEFTTNPNWGESAVRKGRRVLHYEGSGFVNCYVFQSTDVAKRVFQAHFISPNDADD